MRESEAAKSNPQTPAPASVSANPAHASQLIAERPTYAAVFRCIGPECEDPCCSDWDIPLDKTTYAKYQEFPPQPLGATVSEFVVLNGPSHPPELHGRIRRTPEGPCPFFAADRLCAIEKEYGRGLLSATCSIYPRSLSRVEGVLEGSLSLSCPEAARNVLLIPDFAQRAGNLLSGDFRTDNVYRLAGHPSVGDQAACAKPPGAYLAVRAACIAMVQDRSQPLWRRLLRVGLACQGLDALGPAATERDFLGFLDRLGRTSDNAQSLHKFDALPSQPQLRLDATFSLTAPLLEHDPRSSFQETFWMFAAGIGAPADSPPGDDVERFVRAESGHLRPFLDKSTFILENYLVNSMFQNLFPYGRAGSAGFAPKSMFEEFLQMATKYACIRSLLVGVAGHRKDSFAKEDVVRTVQSFTRAIEHYPAIVRWFGDHLRSRDLDSLQGMVALLKDD